MEDLTDRLLTRLGDPPEGGVCAKCLAAALGVDRWDVLKGIRELVLTGRVLCSVDVCAVCRTREPVALRRRRSLY